MNKKQRNFRLTDQEYEFVKQAIKWFRDMRVPVEVGATTTVPNPFATGTIPQPALQATPQPIHNPKDQGYNCNPGFGVSVTDFLGGFKHKPCDNDDYYEFDGTIPQGIINEVLAHNNAEESDRIVAQTQAAMKKQFAIGVIVGREEYVAALTKVRDAYAMGC